MRYPDSVDDIFSNVAEETGFSRETVKFVIKNFEKNLASYLRNPLKSKGNIILNGFLKIEFKVDDALARLDTLKRYMPRSKDIQIYEEYLKNVITNDTEEEK